MNVQNNDAFCFKFAVWIPKLTCEKNRERVASYLSDPHFESGYNWDRVQYPVKICDIIKFEKANNIIISVYGIDEKNLIYPVKVCDEELADHRDLLYIEDGDKCHYAYISNFERFISSQLSLHKEKKTFM